MVEGVGEDSNDESSKSNNKDNVAEVTVIECGCKELNIVSKSFQKYPENQPEFLVFLVARILKKLLLRGLSLNPNHQT